MKAEQPLGVAQIVLQSGCLVNVLPRILGIEFETRMTSGDNEGMLEESERPRDVKYQV